MARQPDEMGDSPPSAIPHCVWQERDIEELKTENAELKQTIEGLSAALRGALEVNAVGYEKWRREMDELHQPGLRQRPIHVGRAM